ncbi:hypothetical protein OUY22_11270 [Nonomuraea sp. MCN248]|uniref:Uncharacterized protein n=1 Tax=Nonomuraea corallina TaxID=2989783 RepID=A0ABT4S9V2_9ACTN|nr:hypothetical protein [Nonomuraea corallina]MDA0633998.1 hypothetical protein [Nonomuraea corallina]
MGTYEQRVDNVVRVLQNRPAWTRTKIDNTSGAGLAMQKQGHDVVMSESEKVLENGR